MCRRPNLGSVSLLVYPGREGQTIFYKSLSFDSESSDHSHINVFFAHSPLITVDKIGVDLCKTAPFLSSGNITSLSTVCILGKPKSLKAIKFQFLNFICIFVVIDNTTFIFSNS